MMELGILITFRFLVTVLYSGTWYLIISLHSGIQYSYWFVLWILVNLSLVMILLYLLSLFREGIE